MKRNLDFLQQALGTAPFRRVWRGALEKLQELLWADVLMRQSFTTFGAAQFARDVGAVVSLAERYLPSGAGHLSGLQEGLVLLNLPVVDADGDGDGRDGRRLMLKEASDRVFTDNTEAKKVLEELGIEGLTPANARNILQRRVENSE